MSPLSPVSSRVLAGDGVVVCGVGEQGAVDDIEQSSFERADRLRPGGSGCGPTAVRRRRKAIASGCDLAWVSAMRWLAALSCRFPARLSRCRSVLPDETGVGAVPLWRANAAQPAQRRAHRSGRTCHRCAPSHASAPSISGHPHNPFPVFGAAGFEVADGEFDDGAVAVELVGFDGGEVGAVGDERVVSPFGELNRRSCAVSGNRVRRATRRTVRIFNESRRPTV